MSMRTRILSSTTVAILTSLALLAPLAAAAAQQDEPRPIGAEKLLTRLQGDAASRPLVLDVRTPEEYAEGHVPGAINIPHTELAARLDEVRAAGDRDIVVYCKSGKRAGIAYEALTKAGFERLLHLRGDMQGWLKKELPVEKPQS